MCTAATYKTKDFYFGRTLDYEFSYGDEIHFIMMLSMKKVLEWQALILLETLYIMR